MGLYLEQVTKYINGFLVPIGCAEITSSMVSNYVKKRVIEPPVKKQYYADQIGYLFFISIAKNVLSMKNISDMFIIQKKTYDSATAYNYFCSEFENMLWHICGLKDTVDTLGITDTKAKTICRSVVISASHMLFTINCFESLN